MPARPLSDDAQRELVELIRAGLRDRLAPRLAPGVGSDPEVPDSSQNLELLAPAGCFVTLHRHRDQRLRGCIGRLDASQPLWHAALDMAGSVLADPRFVDNPVTFDELPHLDFDVSILSPLEPTASPDDFDVLTEGIYLACEGRTGCFLPQVARETGWSREQLLDRLCSEKMGLPPSRWRSPGAVLSKFSVTVVGPVPAVSKSS